MAVITRLFVVAVLAYCGYGLLLFALQRRTLYPGAYMMSGPALRAGAPAGAERVVLTTEVGRTEAWYVASDLETQGPAPAMIVFHGNAEFARDLPYGFRRLAALGIACLFVEYPGYDGSEGRPTESTIAAVGQGAFDWLTRRQDIDPDRISVLGRSLGSGAAALLSRARPVRALVLWSPFVSVGYFAWHGFRLPPFLARDRFDVRRAARSFAGPILMFHGRSDRVIPYRHAEVLREAVPEAELVTWDCGHNDCPPSPSELWEPLENFLRRHELIPD